MKAAIRKKPPYFRQSRRERHGYLDLLRQYRRGNTAQNKDMLQGAFGTAPPVHPEAISLKKIQASGAEWTTVHAAYPMQDLQPRIIPLSSRAEIPTLRNAVARAVEVTHLRDALVSDRMGWVCTEDGHWIADLFPTLNARFLRALPRMKTAASKSARPLEGTSVLLASPDASNYYHWLHQILPQIDAIRTAVPESQIDRWLVRDLRAFSCDTLARLGIDLAKVEVLGNHPVMCDRLVVGTLPSMGALNYEGDWPRSLLRNLYLPAATIKPWRRVYLRRGDGERRPILNADAVEHFLAVEGFETCALETMTIAEQARLMAETATIVAPHGAALANLVFCAPETRVVELLPRLWPSPLYGMVAQACGLWHAFVPGTEPSIPVLKIRRETAATKVSISRLAHALEVAA